MLVDQDRQRIWIQQADCCGTYPFLSLIWSSCCFIFPCSTPCAIPAPMGLLTSTIIHGKSLSFLTSVPEVCAAIKWFMAALQQPSWVEHAFHQCLPWIGFEAFGCPGTVCPGAIQNDFRYPKKLQMQNLDFQFWLKRAGKTSTVLSISFVREVGKEESSLSLKLCNFYLFND